MACVQDLWKRRRPVFVPVSNDHVDGLFADDEDRGLSVKARDGGENGRVDNSQPKRPSYSQSRVRDGHVVVVGADGTTARRMLSPRRILYITSRLLIRLMTRPGQEFL